MKQGQTPQLILEDVHYQTQGCLVCGSGCYGTGLHLLTGPIGSGKSTLAALMVKTLKPMQGTVHHHAISRSLLSIQFPEHYVTAITVSGEIESWGLSPKPLLDMFSLQDRADDPVMSLSRGELKRLHLACVVAQHADLLVLDEPFASLDKNGQQWLFEALKSTGRDHIVVIITHYGIPAQYPLMTHSVMNNGFFTQHTYQTHGGIE